MPRSSWIIWIIIEGLACFNLSGQVARFGIEDGLSSRDVTAIIQTQNGAMWIGTADGLNFYDGYTFSRYDWDGITSTKIKCAYEDQRGLLWLGTWDGLTILDPSTGKTIHHFREVADSGKVSNNRVNCITGLDNGQVLVTYGDGILCLFTSSDSYRVVYRATGHEDKQRHQITALEAGDGSTWIVTDYQKVSRLDADFRPVETFDNSVESVVSVYYDAGSRFLYLPDRWGHVYKASCETGKIERDSLLDILNSRFAKVTAMYVTENDAMWLGYDDGHLVQVNLRDQSVTDHTEVISPYFSGPPRTIFADRSGTMWIGGNYGLVRFADTHPLFDKILSKPLHARPSEKISVRGMCEDSDGTIYIGSYNGLFEYQPHSNSIHQFTFNVSGKALTHAYYPYRLVNDGPFIWVASEVRGLYRFRKASSRLEFPVDKSPKACYALLADGADTLWVGTGSGLYLYSRKNNTIEAYKGQADRFDISGLEISDLTLTPSNDLWIGTRSSGIFLLERRKGITRHIVNTERGESIRSVTCLYSDNDTLWVGTRGEGLYQLKPGNKSRRFLTNDGLAGNAIASVTRDKDGRLWIATFNGLSRMQVNGDGFENYTVRDGLSDNEFNMASTLVASDGRMYLGGLNGVCFFDPAVLQKRKTYAPRVFLTRLVTFDEESGGVEDRAGDLTGVGDLSFSHHNRFCSFSFALDDYGDPPSNVFSYLFEGADTSWRSLGDQNTVRFDRLAAGHYTLRIRGVSSQGMASVNQLVFPLSVSPPFYLTWWFVCLVIGFTALFVYLVTRYFYHQKLKLANLRTRISSDLHDEVGGLLTRISVQAELMKQGLPEHRTVAGASRIASASRQATEAMSDILWSIDARNDKMSSLLDKFREHISETLEPMGIDVDFYIEGIQGEAAINNTRRQDLLLLFKEAVSNVANHSGATHVRVELIQRKNTALLRIVDNGQGGIVSEGHTGQGLRNMRMRAERLGGQLNVSSAEGCTVEFTCKGTFA